MQLKVMYTVVNVPDKEWFYWQYVSFLGGKYTKEDFKAYEKDLDNKSKLALKDNVKTKQEYPLHLNHTWTTVCHFVRFALI